MGRYEENGIPTNENETHLIDHAASVHVHRPPYKGF